MTEITINTSNKISSVSPMLYGIFFEDINYAGDGGLYAELIANRSFEYYDRSRNNAKTDDCSRREFHDIPAGSDSHADPDNTANHSSKASLSNTSRSTAGDSNDRETADPRRLCWETIGDCNFSINTRFPLSHAHGNYARLTGGAYSGIRNLGYCQEGLAVKNGMEFRFSCYARNPLPMSLLIRLADKEGKIYCEKKLSLVRVGRGWTRYTMTLTACGDCKYVYPEILLGREGSADLDLISLFPADTFRRRKNGLRKDLAQMLQALSPKFMRFPGGCIVEGRSFDNMYNWKDTIGDLTSRRTNWNRWQMEEYQLNGRSSEDYFQSYGLGFYEYFQLCEDIGAKPIPVVNAGMTCQWHEGLLVDMEQLDAWIQDAMDLIEFANGSPDSGWGQIRAEMGHPAPFGLEYIGIGNEQWGEVYFQRYEAFQKAISAKYPQIKLITSAGWTSEGEDFASAYAWLNANKDKAYAVDEHFYKSPEWFLKNICRYDNYDRSLPKVFAGEYAAHTCSQIEKRENNWYAALCEAAFLTGIEKNADHVAMACYAPLFGRSGRQQWQPNLIWFDNDSVYGTPSYYVQQLFSCHVGTSLADTKLAGTFTGTYSSTLSEDGMHLYVKLINLAEQTANVSIHTDKSVIECTLHELSAELNAVNSHARPANVSPTVRKLTLLPSGLPELTLPGYSVTVLDLTLQSSSAL